MLDQLSKNITRCGLSNSTLNYLRVSWAHIHHFNLRITCYSNVFLFIVFGSWSSHCLVTALTKYLFITDIIGFQIIAVPDWNVQSRFHICHPPASTLCTALVFNITFEHVIDIHIVLCVFLTMKDTWEKLFRVHLAQTLNRSLTIVKPFYFSVMPVKSTGHFSSVSCKPSSVSSLTAPHLLHLESHHGFVAVMEVKVQAAAQTVFIFTHSPTTQVHRRLIEIQMNIYFSYLRISRSTGDVICLEHQPIVSRPNQLEHILWS